MGVWERVFGYARVCVGILCACVGGYTVYMYVGGYTVDVYVFICRYTHIQTLIPTHVPVCVWVYALCYISRCGYPATGKVVMDTCLYADTNTHTGVCRCASMCW